MGRVCNFTSKRKWICQLVIFNLIIVKLVNLCAHNYGSMLTHLDVGWCLFENYEVKWLLCVFIHGCSNKIFNLSILIKFWLILVFECPYGMINVYMFQNLVIVCLHIKLVANICNESTETNVRGIFVVVHDCTFHYWVLISTGSTCQNF